MENWEKYVMLFVPRQNVFSLMTIFLMASVLYIKLLGARDKIQQNAGYSYYWKIFDDRYI